MFLSERCATCGCSEDSHTNKQLGADGCDEDCPEDCNEDHPSDDEFECFGCGECDDYVWMAEPYEEVCRCGCAVADHEAVERDDADDDVGLVGDASAAADVTALGDAQTADDLIPSSAGVECPCGDCRMLSPAGPAYVLVAEMAQERAGRQWPGGTADVHVVDAPIGRVMTDFVDEVLTVSASILVVDGVVERVDGPVQSGAAIALIIAETGDGLPVALTWDDVDWCGPPLE